MTDVVVQVTGLHKEFGSRNRTVAVDSLDLTLVRGAALGIVGESGSGKSTTARCLVGLEMPTRGTIEICGRLRGSKHVSLKERRARAREVQMVFQDPYSSLPPTMSVRQTLVQALALTHNLNRSQVTNSQVEELLALVELPTERAHAYPKQLSGGQRQRVAIARALAAEPEVLVLDEAVAALDVSVQAQILNLLADVRDARGLAYIFISHDLNVIRQVTDDVIVMQRGVVVERGPTEAVLATPNHEYTRLLLAAVPKPGWDPRGGRGVISRADTMSGDRR